MATAGTPLPLKSAYSTSDGVIPSSVATSQAGSRFVERPRRFRGS
jgi:hypothetical protein